MSEHLLQPWWTGNNVLVQNQRRREEQTVVIATALAVMLGTFALGMLGIVVIGALTDMSQAFNAALVWVGLGAMSVGVVHLIRSGY